MKAKYRIVEHQGFYRDWYEVQKRLFGFLWWYNYEKVDDCTTGIYNSREEAEESINANKHKITKRILEVTK